MPSTTFHFGDANQQRPGRSRKIRPPKSAAIGAIRPAATMPSVPRTISMAAKACRDKRDTSPKGEVLRCDHAVKRVRKCDCFRSHGIHCRQ